ncbi:hypothetical protein O3M35_006542 [Rhynocoris fuscipes]|uniref:Mitochondrial proton/calcium exchanger protein n=1 Tax=Rhynocoris fuscipes TaxID=488301 RepID=A0AAW1DFA3_9HEMI
MYSLLKYNNALVIRRKYNFNGEKLSQAILQKYSTLCSPASSNFCTGIIVASKCDRRKHLENETFKSIILSNNFNQTSCRNFQTGAINWYAVEPGKPSSKVEETVTALKEKALEQKKVKEQTSTTSALQETSTTALAKPKKSLKEKIKAEILHYYHGFKLLWIDINISRKLIWRLLRGYPLTRREHKLLVRTVGDVFRLVPFSVFIIVPFLEFALPFFIKFFPGMLPSQFETPKEKDDKLKRSLKVKIEMAKFLQRTLDDMAVSSTGHSSEAAKEFAQFFENVRKSGHMTSSEEIMKFSKLFEDEITLDSLPRPQLMALCRVLEMNPIGTTNFLRFQLRLKLRSLAADDMMIHLEGVDSLSQSELQAACRARGMRALGVSEERLKAQLKQWLDLSLVKKVPPSLLLLSQAFMLPETTPTEEKLAATIQALPDAVGTATKAVIGEREGKVDYKTKIDLIKEEEAMIKEERMEELEDQVKLKEKEAKEKEKRAEEILTDPAPVIREGTTMDPTLRAAVEETRHSADPGKLVSDEVTTKDIEALESAIDCLGKSQKKLIVEKEELQELREEMKDYQEDVADLQKLMMEVGKDVDVKETKAAKRLFKKVNSMITKIDSVLNELEKKQVADKKKEDEADRKAVGEPSAGVKMDKVESKSTETDPVTKTGDETLRIDDLINTLRKLHSKEDVSRLERIKEILSKMDADRDGAVRVDVVLKMLDLVGNENVKLSKKQVDELIALIDKEEVLQVVQECEKKKEDERKAAILANTEKSTSDTVTTTKTSSNGTGSKGEPPSGSSSGPKGKSGNSPSDPSSSGKLNCERSDYKPSAVETIVSTCSTDTMDINERKDKLDAFTTITTATIQTPSKSTNAHKTIAEPTPGSVTPKNLR